MEDQKEYNCDTCEKGDCEFCEGNPENQPLETSETSELIDMLIDPDAYENGVKDASYWLAYIQTLALSGLSQNLIIAFVNNKMAIEANMRIADNDNVTATEVSKIQGSNGGLIQ